MEKRSLIPSTCVRFLSFLVDSVRQAYKLPADEIENFAVLGENILLSELVHVKTMQRFTGK